MAEMYIHTCVYINIYLHDNAMLLCCVQCKILLILKGIVQYFGIMILCKIMVQFDK